MNADHDFQIGKEHIVCEDYSLSGLIENQPYAIVCDGCSASADVDFGARALALSAREILVRNKDNTFFQNGINYQDFGFSVIVRAESIFNDFPSLNKQALDATLLVVWIRNKKFTAYVYGDGVFFRKHGPCNFLYNHVEFEPGAPDYLSYLIDGERKKAYIKENIIRKSTTVFVDGLESKSQINVLDPFTPMVIEGSCLDGDILGVASDGINSFRNPDNTPISWEEIIKEYTGYKNYEGQFVKRRMSAFKRKCIKEGITHFDDISIASIVV